MKDKFDILENAENDVLERLASSHPKPDKAYIDKIFAMTEQKLSENETSSDEFSPNSVIGVEHYRRSIGVRSAVAAAFAGLLLIGGAIGAFRLMKNVKVVEPDPVIPPNIVTAVVTTAADISNETNTTSKTDTKNTRTAAVTVKADTETTAVTVNAPAVNTNAASANAQQPVATNAGGRQIVRVTPPTTTRVTTTAVTTSTEPVPAPSAAATEPAANTTERPHVEMNSNDIGLLLNNYLKYDNIINKVNVSKSPTDIIEFRSFNYHRPDGTTYVPDHDGNTVFRYALVTDSAFSDPDDFTEYITNIAADQNSIIDNLSARMPAPVFTNYTPDYEGPSGNVRIPELDEYFAETEKTNVNITFPLFLEYNGKLYATLDMSSNDDFICSGFDTANMTTEVREDDPDTIYVSCPYANADPNLWYCNDFMFYCELKHDTENDVWYVKNVKHSYREWYDFADEEN